MGLTRTNWYALTSAAAYSTTFPSAPENPISEGGRWFHRSTISADETVVATASVGGGVNVAQCTMVGGAFNDSSAYLSGFGPNHMAQGVIWKSPTISGSFQEVEILLRWVDGLAERTTPSFGNTTVLGYEINVNVDDGSYLNIGQFKASAALATINLATLIGRVPRTGDLFGASVRTVGSNALITVFWNGVQVLQTTDTNPITGGNPGMGFFHNAGEANSEFGFSSYSAADI